MHKRRARHQPQPLVARGGALCLKSGQFPEQRRLAMDLLLLILILLIVLSFSGWGYGYYNRGAYSSPIGLLGVILLVLLLLMIFTSWRSPWVL
jgi:hypothetical protein